MSLPQAFDEIQIGQQLRDAQGPVLSVGRDRRDRVPAAGDVVRRDRLPLRPAAAREFEARDLNRGLSCRRRRSCARSDQLMHHPLTYVAFGDADRASFYIEKLYETRSIDGAVLKFDHEWTGSAASRPFKD